MTRGKGCAGGAWAGFSSGAGAAADAGRAGRAQCRTRAVPAELRHLARRRAAPFPLRDQEALDAYDRALALDPGYASAYASRGVAHHRLGHLDQALADLDRALELNPSYAWARERRDAVVRDLDG
ncbi:tetratricopeptide repeat protein [Streptomyces sp. enrichment culture]|uniref:tetratricopeptide repeat protein n=1 Tax=Streptomyces sp. enrichment culture TaxID=1795815 RepID=UPI0029A6B846|nr:tetratricopeptide repeat protein [Streptomyces sp. MD20-1-1]